MTDKIKLTLEARAAYYLILEMIFCEGGPIERNDRWLANELRCPVNTATSLFDELLVASKIFMTADGKVSNHISKFERTNAYRFRAALAQISSLRAYTGEDMGRVKGYKVAAEIAERALLHDFRRSHPEDGGWRSYRTSVVFDGGGFDVSGCPDPEQLAAFVVEAVNRYVAPPADQRPLFEAAVVARLQESGFLEIEIRTECLARVGDGYQDEVINAGWYYWKAASAILK